jgi:hypothetical protein
MALIDTLNASINQYDDTDVVWRQFISDHKQYLIGQSQTYSISSSYLQSYIFSMKRYLRSIGYNTHLAWIVSLINNIPSDVQFVAGTTLLYVPSLTLIQSLYTNYVTANPIPV